jgi:hypothetical protein
MASDIKLQILWYHYKKKELLTQCFTFYFKYKIIFTFPIITDTLYIYNINN